MVYSTHPHFTLHLPQNNPQSEHLVSFSARRSSFQCYFLPGKKTVAGEGSEGAPYQQLAAARVEASNEGTSIRSGPLRAFGLAARPGQNTRRMAPKAWPLQTALGFSRETELHRLPETRSADRRQLSHNTAHSVAMRLRAALSIGQRAAKRH